jgi:hypothetical protein
MARAKTPKQLQVHIRFLKRQLVTAEKNLKKAKVKKSVKKKVTRKAPVKRKKAVSKKRR